MVGAVVTNLLAQSKLLLTVARTLEAFLAATYPKDARTLDLTQAIVDFTSAPVQRRDKDEETPSDSKASATLAAPTNSDVAITDEMREAVREAGDYLPHATERVDSIIRAILAHANVQTAHPSVSSDGSDGFVTWVGYDSDPPSPEATRLASLMCCVSEGDGSLQFEIHAGATVEIHVTSDGVIDSVYSTYPQTAVKDAPKLDLRSLVTPEATLRALRIFWGDVGDGDVSDDHGDMRAALLDFIASAEEKA